MARPFCAGRYRLEMIIKRPREKGLVQVQYQTRSLTQAQTRVLISNRHYMQPPF